MFGTLVLALLIFKTTLQHYVPPPSACLLSKFCNHTWIPECGQESAQKNMRMFLDLCDMHEFNCEKTKYYNKVDLKECPQDSTTLSVTNTTPESTETTISIDTTASATATVATTKPTSETINEPENSTTLSIETTIISTRIASISTESTAKSCCCSCTKAISTTEPPTTSSSIETTLPSSDTLKIETTVVSTTTPKTTIPVTSLFSECTRHSTKRTKNTVTTTTEKTVTTTSTEISTLSTEPTNKELNIPQTTIDDYEETETVTYATIVEDIKTVTAQTEARTIPSASLVTCSSYPKDCDIPSTWETTAKGETRDFFQILRERFGDKVKLLKATTHWPRRVMVNNQRSAFFNERHWDSRVK